VSVSTTDRLLTAEELRARWQLKTKDAVYRLTREGVIPAGAVVKLGRFYRYRLEGIEAFEKQGGELAA